MNDPELNEVMDEILAISKEVREMEKKEALAKSNRELLERIAELAANDPNFLVNQIQDVRKYAEEHPEDERLNAILRAQDQQITALLQDGNPSEVEWPDPPTVKFAVAHTDDVGPPSQEKQDEQLRALWKLEETGEDDAAE